MMKTVTIDQKLVNKDEDTETVFAIHLLNNGVIQNVEGKKVTAVIANDDGFLFDVNLTANGETVFMDFQDDKLESLKPGAYKMEIRVVETNGDVGIYPSDVFAHFDVIENLGGGKRLDGGIVFSMMGDSYVRGDSVGPENVAYTLAAANLGLTYNNYGLNGDTMAEYDGRKAKRPPMTVRYLDIASDSNIIGIEAGRNDYGKNIPIGEDTDTTDRTFKGAINIVCKGIEEKFPNAIKFGVPCWRVTIAPDNTLGFNQVDYFDAFNHIVHDIHGWPVLDVTDVGVYMDDPNFRNHYAETPDDESHLNKEGHINYAPHLEKFLTELLLK